MSDSGAQKRSDRPTDGSAGSPADQAAAAEETHNLEQVLGVGSSVLRDALIGAGSDGLDFEQLETVFGNAQHAMVAATSDTPAESESASSPSQAPRRREDDRPGLPVAVLEQKLQEMSPERAPVVDFEERDVPLEHASILLQMLPIASNEDTTSFVARRLSRIPTGERLEALEICRDALVELAEELTFESFDRVFPSLAPVLRLDGRMPLMETLATLGQQCSERGRESLWPYVADEYLRRKAGTSSSSEAKSLRFLDELQPHCVPRAVQRLCGLPALAERKLVKDFFAVGQPRGYRFMAYLLASPRADLVGPDVFAGLRSHPITLPGAAEVLQALERYRPEYATFLHHLLLDMVSGRATRERGDEACTLLVRAIRRLDAERRKEHWVTHAIDYLGEMAWAGARPLLETIATQRRWGIGHAWPSDCRKSAQRALESLPGSEASDDS